MSLPSLPWFIRKEIIDLVIQDNPQYVSINKEWLKQVFEYHSVLSFQNAILPQTNNKHNSILIPFFTEVKFRRNSEIDWNFIETCKHIDEVEIFFLVQPTKKHELFMDNLLQLPYLAALSLYMFEVYPVDITNIIQRNQYSLKELNLVLLSELWFPVITKTLLPNLIRLTIFGDTETFVVQDVIKKIPKLRSLKLYYNTPLFIDTKILSITELALDSKNGSAVCNLDFNIFPNLKKLSIRIGIEFASKKPCETLEELKISGHTDLMYSVICKKFPKLKKLDVAIKSNILSYYLVTFFSGYKHLNALKILVWGFYKFPKYLPMGPFFITSLSLEGCFLITNHLLQWLSSNFKLRRLELLRCHLKKEQLEVLPFDQLESVIVRAYDECYEQYSKVFNSVNCPRLRAIDIEGFNPRCAGYHCTYNFDSYISS